MYNNKSIGHGMAASLIIILFFQGTASADLRGKTLVGLYSADACPIGPISGLKRCVHVSRNAHMNLYLGNNNAYDYTSHRSGHVVNYGSGKDEISISGNDVVIHEGILQMHLVVLGSGCRMFFTGGTPSIANKVHVDYCRVINGHAER